MPERDRQTIVNYCTVERIRVLYSALFSSGRPIYVSFDRDDVRTLLDEIDRLKAACDIFEKNSAGAAELFEDNLRLKAQVEGHCARIAAQSDLLSRRAEKSP